MSAAVVADILARILEDEAFAKNIIQDPKTALAPYEKDLTSEEFTALAERVEPWNVEPILSAPHVGAWKILARDIDHVPADLRARLNAALAKRSMPRIAIPVTGA